MISTSASSLIAPFPAGEARPVGLVSTAHGFSLFYMLVLPPVFPLLGVFTLAGVRSARAAPRPA